jgi:hypothetical protein
LKDGARNRWTTIDTRQRAEDVSHRITWKNRVLDEHRCAQLPSTSLFLVRGALSDAFISVDREHTLYSGPLHPTSVK